MNLRLSKPWIELTAANIESVGGYLGVFQLADVGGAVVYIGLAGGRELFGLQSALRRQFERRLPGVERFRYEVNQQYQSRFRELLMLYRADHGRLPEHNRAEELPPLGRMG